MWSGVHDGTISVIVVSVFQMWGAVESECHRKFVSLKSGNDLYWNYHIFNVMTEHGKVCAPDLFHKIGLSECFLLR